MSCAAASALGSIGDARAEAPLRALLGDEDPVLRGCAAGGLGLLGSREGLSLAIELCQSDDRNVQRAALQALAHIGDARAEGWLRKLLEDPADPNAPWAYVALRAIETRSRPREERVRLLRADLDREEVVQDWAARELAALGEAEAVAALRDGLRGPDGRVRRPVLLQLYKLGVAVEE